MPEYRAEVDLDPSEAVQRLFYRVESFECRIIFHQTYGPAGGCPRILLGCRTKKKLLDFLEQQTGDAREFLETMVYRAER